jgi:nucleotide-binding universal stress UspA family protein
MATRNRRRCFEAGHRPKLLVVVDDTPECSRAVYFAARRAKRIGAIVLMLVVIAPNEFENWLGVGDVMQEEAEGEARVTLAKVSALSRELTGAEPEQVTRRGTQADEIQALIEEDEDILFLVLAAGTGREGPGPLVSTLAGKMAPNFPIPIVLVPGHLDDADIDALA